MENTSRKRIRVPGYDYSSSGCYAITICTEGRLRVLSSIREEEGAAIVELSEYGKIVERNIQTMNGIYAHIQVEKYVIMPDHVHMLLRVQDASKKNGTEEVKNSAVSKFVGTLKRFCNKEFGKNIWQPRSNDHIIRDQEDYNTRWNYMENNPMSWILNGKNKIPPVR